MDNHDFIHLVIGASAIVSMVVAISARYFVKNTLGSFNKTIATEKFKIDLVKRINDSQLKK